MGRGKSKNESERNVMCTYCVKTEEGKCVRICLKEICDISAISKKRVSTVKCHVIIKKTSD